MGPGEFVAQPFPLVAVKPSTGSPFLVIGWQIEQGRSVPRPFVVPLDAHGGPMVVYEHDALDYLEPGQDAKSYLAERWGRKQVNGNTHG